jgi:hypothetical protein
VSITASDAEDPAAALVVEWNVDGGPWQPAAYNATTERHEATWNTLSVADGPHTLAARATDTAGASGSDANAVAVDNLTSIHVGDLDRSSAFVGFNRWRATATIAVHTNLEGIVSGATVTGVWSGGFSGTASCTTNGNGRCSVTSGNIRLRDTSATFTVTNVTNTLSYQSGGNHDPDGDSTGTSITVPRP